MIHIRNVSLSFKLRVRFMSSFYRITYYSAYPTYILSILQIIVQGIQSYTSSIRSMIHNSLENRTWNIGFTPQNYFREDRHMGTNLFNFKCLVVNCKIIWQMYIYFSCQLFELLSYLGILFFSIRHI